ncbi:LADA_0D13190g1_1 [Lachancea dasiensis]|uniref:LADA_0D13190g1_1 n=1 Tax=Lachancea dasiensis TaxID=1072105 RepID=A0A1G4J8N7_9SACH|nr:LADA_0D13190g1_1 [Lachancea dasiensis]
MDTSDNASSRDMYSNDKKNTKVVSAEIELGSFQDVEVFPQQNIPTDKAFQFLAGREIEYSEEEGNQVLRKIDRNILPILFWIYCIQFADKVSLSYAALMGIREDTNLAASSQQYAWVSSIFYAGYIFWEFPTTFFLTKFPIGKYLSINIFLWGVVLTLTSVAQNYGGLLALRWFLGMFESSVTPGFVLITAMWYKRSEQAKRMGFWLAANGLATLVTSPVAYGLSYVTNASISAWKILFLLFGLLTILTGTLYFFLLPDSALNARFLTEREKEIAIERIRGNFQGIGSQKWKMSQVWEAFQDPRTYLYVLFSLLMNIPNGGVTSFGSIIIKSFGYKNQRALLLSMPGGGVDIAFKLAMPFLSDWLMDRSFPAMIAIAFPMVGGIMMSTIDVSNKVPLLIGYYFISAAGSSWGLVMSMIACNTVGSTKKSVVNGLQILAYAAGNWIGPQTFRSSQAPEYPTGKRLVAIFYGLALLTLLAIRLINIYENRRRDKLEAEGKIPEFPENAEFLDLTDFQQLKMRYVL